MLPRTLSCRPTSARTRPRTTRWALALGCRPIYLVGMDAAYRNGQTDFWGANSHHHGGATLSIMRKELTRLHLDFPGDILAIPTGQVLREIAGELPDVDQAVKRRTLLAELSSALQHRPAPHHPAGDETAPPVSHGPPTAECTES